MKEVICACGVCLYSCLNWQNVFVSNCKNAFVSNWKHVFVSICKKCISFKLQTCICLKLKKNMSLYQFAKNVVVSNWRKMYICLKLNRLLRGRGDGITFVRRSLYFSQVAKMYLHHSSHSQSQSQSNLNLKKMYLFQIAKFICIKLKTWSWIQVLNCLKCQKFYTRLDGASKDAQCPSFTLLLLLVFVMVIEVRMCLDFTLVRKEWASRRVSNLKHRSPHSCHLEFNMSSGKQEESLEYGKCQEIGKTT